MAGHDDRCLIWGTKANKRQINADLDEVDSDRAGGLYRITGSAVATISSRTDESKIALTNWLVDQRRLGDASPEIDSRTLDHLDFAALRVQERLDRALMCIDSLGGKIGQTYRVGGFQDENTTRLKNLLLAWTGSKDSSEVTWLLSQLEQAGLVNRHDHSFAINAGGWARLEALRASHVPSTQGFVAMWFNEDTDAAFSDGIEPAIRDCGFVPLRIDRKEHVNKIDDEIVAEIRRSRFVVADFTSERDRPRGGVYFEAGFALGLGIPVIWTCRADLIDQVHFDTRQFNHITWSDPGEFRDRLKNRIGAVVGFGPGASFP